MEMVGSGEVVVGSCWWWSAEFIRGSAEVHAPLSLSLPISRVILGAPPLRLAGRPQLLAARSGGQDADVSGESLITPVVGNGGDKDN